MIEKKKDSKFEFVLMVNSFPIISRFFPVEDYNPKVRNSVDIRDIAEDIVSQIQSLLKQKDVDYMWGKYDLRENAFMNKWSTEIKSAKKYLEKK